MLASQAAIIHMVAPNGTGKKRVKKNINSSNSAIAKTVKLVVPALQQLLPLPLLTLDKQHKKCNRYPKHIMQHKQHKKCSRYPKHGQNVWNTIFSFHQHMQYVADV